MAQTIRKLAIVGASARAAAFSALRAGFEVVAADLFADADLARHCPVTQLSGYPDTLFEWLSRTPCDAWLYTGALENHPELIDRMAGVRPLLGNAGESLRKSRDPLLLQEVFGAATLLFPETLPDSAGLPLDGTWLCKTYRSASGLGVWPLDGIDSRDRALKAGAVYQRLIEGLIWNAAAIYVLGENDSHLLGLTQQFVGGPGAPRSWQYIGSMGPSPINTALEEQLIRLRDVLARQLGLRGIVGVDLVVEDDRAWIVEINPRYSASAEIVERTLGHSVIGLQIAASSSTGGPIASSATPPRIHAESPLRTYGKQIVFAQRAVTITERFHQWALRRASLELDKAATADIPHAGADIGQGHPVLTVFGEGPSLGCYEQLRSRVAEVESRLYG